MRWLSFAAVILLTMLLTTACATNEPARSSGITAGIVEPIEISWGVYSDNPGHLTYQHEGIPGNIATITNTIGPDGKPLPAIVLGMPLERDEQVTVRLLGVLEQAGPNGLVSTVIATVGNEQDLIEMESEQSGSLAVLEAGIVKIDPHQSRSLGFQSAAHAYALINRYRK